MLEYYCNNSAKRQFPITKTFTTPSVNSLGVFTTEPTTLLQKTRNNITFGSKEFTKRKLADSTRKQRICRSSLRGNDLTDSCAEDLASALRTNRSLIDLNLGVNKLGDSGVKLLSVALRNPDCKIQELHLRGNDLTDSCAEDLASALSTNRSLIDLNLGDNKLGDSGVKLLSVALRNPECKIQKLHLRGNNLTDSCAEDLASALGTNRSLIDLNLGGNKLGDSGVKLLSVALRNPECKIQTLHLYNNALTDSCAEDLASALSTKQSLRNLYLESNSFTDQSVPALRRLILTCRSLEEIRLQGNQFSPNGKTQLESLRGSRRGLTVIV
ncbi:NACHT, LRR and PYD domains-containing protein 3-like [Mustelus asterias]